MNDLGVSHGLPALAAGEYSRLSHQALRQGGRSEERAGGSVFWDATRLGPPHRRGQENMFSCRGGRPARELLGRRWPETLFHRLAAARRGHDLGPGGLTAFVWRVPRVASHTVAWTGLQLLRLPGLPANGPASFCKTPPVC